MLHSARSAKHKQSQRVEIVGAHVFFLNLVCLHICDNQQLREDSKKHLIRESKIIMLIAHSPRFTRLCSSTLLSQCRSLHVSNRRDARGIKPWPVGLEGEYRKARTKKVLKIDLPDFEKFRDNTTVRPDEYVSKLKEKGIAPPRQYKEKPIVITSMQGVLDPYVPPEGDGKYSLLSKGGASQKVTSVKQKGTTFLAIRKIKSYEDDFDPPTFAEDALKIYIKAHELLAAGVKEELLDYVTDFAYPLMKFQTERKTLRWTFVKQNERPLVIQARTQHLIEKENMFAQITVRFNTRQILAIYDRFGHLMHGSEAVVKDVLEYVVFEKNISDYNGRWRLHAKIIPEWTPKKEPIIRTFVRDDAPEAPTEEEIRFEKDGIISDERKEEEEEEKESQKAKAVETIR